MEASPKDAEECGWDAGRGVGLTKVVNILQKTLSGDCWVMDAKGEVGFLTVPFPKIVRGEVSDDALVDGDSAVRQEGLRKSKGRGRSAEKKTSLGELFA